MENEASIDNQDSSPSLYNNSNYQNDYYQNDEIPQRDKGFETPTGNANNLEGNPLSKRNSAQREAR